MRGTRIVDNRRGIVLLAGVAGALLLSACSEPVPPRNFADFMEDRIAREGTLARCNADREATLNDIECANARRAAAAIALRRERERREALERESEMKLAALRNEIELRERRALAEAQSAAAERERAYNRLWDEQAEQDALAPVAAEPRPLLEEVRIPSRFTWRSAVD